VAYGGAAALEPVFLIDAGSTNAVYADSLGNWQANTYQTVSYSDATLYSTVDTSGVVDPAPASIYESESRAESGAGNHIAWDIPVEDGDYVVRLHFVDGYNQNPGVRLFDIEIQGTTVEANFDIVAQAERSTRLWLKTLTSMSRVVLASASTLSIARQPTARSSPVSRCLG